MLAFSVFAASNDPKNDVGVLVGHDVPFAVIDIDSSDTIAVLKERITDISQTLSSFQYFPVSSEKRRGQGVAPTHKHRVRRSTESEASGIDQSADGCRE
jgi:hypothetical protein